MEGDKRPRMQVEEMSKSPCRNPSLGDDIHLSILKIILACWGHLEAKVVKNVLASGEIITSLLFLSELDGLVEVRRFKERDTKISTLLQLWASLITNPNKTDYVSKVFFTLFRKTTVAILSPDWMSVTLSLKEKLINAMDIAGQALKPVIEDSAQLCGVLRRTAQEPWKNKAWKHILDGSLDIDDQGVCYCLAAEPEDVLLARVQFLAQSGCERQAMSLAKCCFKFFTRFQKGPWPSREQDTLNSSDRQGTKVSNYCRFSSMEWFLFLLQKKDKLADIVKEVLILSSEFSTYTPEVLNILPSELRETDCFSKLNRKTASLSCHEGVQLIKFLRRKSTSDPLCQTLTHIFLVRDFMFPSKYCCTKELIVLWVSLHKKRKVNDIADAVRRLLVSYASTSAHFYLFVDVLWEQFGSKLMSLYVEMCVRGLTADVNFLEVARSNEMRETVQELETHISNMWHKLSTLFDEGCEEVARECMLSAFSMRPTQERLYILQSLTHSILSESQMQAYPGEQPEESTSSFGKPEKCRNPHCRCESSCSDDSEKCLAAAESNQLSPLHPLLRRGIKGISYACVKDLVSLLECVRCKTFQFSCFDWYKRSSELGDYLNAYIRNANAQFYSEDMGYPKAQVNPLFHHGGDDMDTESPSDEDVMDYESPASDRLPGNFPLVSSEGVPIHQSPLSVPFKQEQTSCSSWAHSKPESVPPLQLSPLFVDSMDFAPKGLTKHPPHICHSSKSTSFNPLIKSSMGANPNMGKDVHANFMNSSMRNMHMEHRHTTKPEHGPCASNLTVAGATEAMLRSVIMKNSPVTDGFASASNSFLSPKSSPGVPFGMASNMAVHSPHVSNVRSHSPQYSPFPHDMPNPHVKSPEMATLSSLNRIKQHFLPTPPNTGVHQSKPLLGCMPTGSSKDVIDEAFVPRSNINSSIQNVSRTASNINVPHNAFMQNIASPNNLKSDVESSSKLLGHHGSNMVHGHHGSNTMQGHHDSNYIQQGNVLSPSSESLHLSTQDRNISNVLCDREIQGNMLLSLLENRKSDSMTGMQNDCVPPVSHKLPERLPNDAIAKGETLPSYHSENKTSDVLHLEMGSFKEKSVSINEQNSVTKYTAYANISADTSEGQVCSKIPIPVSVNRIPITKMTVEQLSSHEEKKTIPAFKISMPPDMKKPFRNWFFPANLVIPKNSCTTSAGDSTSEPNCECLLEGNAKPLENNAISIPGFIVFKSNKGKCFSTPKVVTGESGTACQIPIQKKVWTSFRSSFGEVACRRMSSSDVNIGGAPTQKLHPKQSEKYPDDLQSVESNGQRFFQSATGPSSDKSMYSSHDRSVIGAGKESHRFFTCTAKSDASLPSATVEPSVVTSALKTVPSCHQTSTVPSNVPHVISVLGKDLHPGLSVCSERKMPPQNVSVGSSDKYLPLLDTQNSNKLERLGSLSVSTDKMCCSENEVVPCQSCSLSAAQAHQSDQSLRAGLSQRRDAAGVKPSGTSNMVSGVKSLQILKNTTVFLCLRVLNQCNPPGDEKEGSRTTESRVKTVNQSSHSHLLKNKKTKLNDMSEKEVCLKNSGQNCVNPHHQESEISKSCFNICNTSKNTMAETPPGNTQNETSRRGEPVLDENNLSRNYPPERDEKEAIFHLSDCFENSLDCENSEVIFKSVFKYKRTVGRREASILCSEAELGGGNVKNYGKHPAEKEMLNGGKDLINKTAVENVEQFPQEDASRNSGSPYEAAVSQRSISFENKTPVENTGVKSKKRKFSQSFVSPEIFHFSESNSHCQKSPIQLHIENKISDFRTRKCRCTKSGGCETGNSQTCKKNKIDPSVTSNVEGSHKGRNESDLSQSGLTVKTTEVLMPSHSNEVGNEEWNHDFSPSASVREGAKHKQGNDSRTERRIKLLESLKRRLKNRGLQLRLSKIAHSRSNEQCTKDSNTREVVVSEIPPKLSVFNSDDAKCFGKNLVCPEIDHFETMSTAEIEQNERRGGISQRTAQNRPVDKYLSHPDHGNKLGECYVEDDSNAILQSAKEEAANCRKPENSVLRQQGGSPPSRILLNSKQVPQLVLETKSVNDKSLQSEGNFSVKSVSVREETNSFGTLSQQDDNGGDSSELENGHTEGENHGHHELSHLSKHMTPRNSSPKEKYEEQCANSVEIKEVFEPAEKTSAFRQSLHSEYSIGEPQRKRANKTEINKKFGSKSEIECIQMDNSDQAFESTPGTSVQTHTETECLNTNSAHQQIDIAAACEQNSSRSQISREATKEDIQHNSGKSKCKNDKNLLEIKSVVEHHHVKMGSVEHNDITPVHHGAGGIDNEFKSRRSERTDAKAVDVGEVQKEIQNGASLSDQLSIENNAEEHKNRVTTRSLYKRGKCSQEDDGTYEACINLSVKSSKSQISENDQFGMDHADFKKPRQKKSSRPKQFLEDASDEFINEKTVQKKQNDEMAQDSRITSHFVTYGNGSIEDMRTLPQSPGNLNDSLQAIIVNQTNLSESHDGNLVNGSHEDVTQGKEETELLGELKLSVQVLEGHSDCTNQKLGGSDAMSEHGKGKSHSAEKRKAAQYSPRNLLESPMPSANKVSENQHVKIGSIRNIHLFSLKEPRLVLKCLTSEAIACMKSTMKESTDPKKNPIPSAFGKEKQDKYLKKEKFEEKSNHKCSGDFLSYVFSQNAKIGPREENLWPCCAAAVKPVVKLQELNVANSEKQTSAQNNSRETNPSVSNVNNCRNVNKPKYFVSSRQPEVLLKNKGCKSFRISPTKHSKYVVQLSAVNVTQNQRFHSHTYTVPGVTKKVRIDSMKSKQVSNTLIPAMLNACNLQPTVVLETVLTNYKLRQPKVFLERLTDF